MNRVARLLLTDELFDTRGKTSREQVKGLYGGQMPKNPYLYPYGRVVMSGGRVSFVIYDLTKRFFILRSLYKQKSVLL